MPVSHQLILVNVSVFHQIILSKNYFVTIETVFLFIVRAIMLTRVECSFCGYYFLQYALKERPEATFFLYSPQEYSTSCTGKRLQVTQG